MFAHHVSHVRIASLVLAAVAGSAATALGQPGSRIALGLDATGPSTVLTAPALLPGLELNPFNAYPNFSGGVRVAVGDVNGDGVAEIITGAGPGAGPHVKIFDGTSNTLMGSFFAYGPTFSGGVYVAAGDVNGDGFADIVTGAGGGGGGAAGGAPHVKVSDGRNGGELHSFFAFDAAFTGGVRVATGDVNGDGRADVIVGAGPGAPGGHVKVFDGATGGQLHSFFAFPGFSGGVFVAAGDLDGDGHAELVVSPDEGGQPMIRIYNPDNPSNPRTLTVGDPRNTSGVRVGTIRTPGGNGIIAILIGLLLPAVQKARIAEIDPMTGEELQARTLEADEFTGRHIFVAGFVPGPRPCVADFNLDGEVNPDDLGDYINCYFSQPPCDRADINEDGTVNPDDLGDYINAFFSRACR